MTTTVKDYKVNVAKTEVINFRIVESNAPRPPTSQLQYVVDQQIIAPLARGNINGTAIQMSNLNFSHVCDFRFIMNFKITDLLGIPDFFGLINQTIRNAKIRASAIIRNAMQRAIELLRLALRALVDALGFDPSGQISFYASLAKDFLWDLYYYAKKIAQYIEDVLVWVEVFKQINAIISYLQSLPARIKALILSCITNFLSSVKNLANQVTNLPNNVLREVNRVVASVDARATQSLNQLTRELTVYTTETVTSDGSYINNSQIQLNRASANTQQVVANTISSYISANSNEELITLATRDTQSISEGFIELSNLSAEAFSNSSNNLTVTVAPAFSSANTKKP